MSIDITVGYEKRWSSHGHMVNVCLAGSSVKRVVTHGDQKKLSGLVQPVGMGGRAGHNGSSSQKQKAREELKAEVYHWLLRSTCIRH